MEKIPRKKVSIVVPVYRSEGILPNLVDTVERILLSDARYDVELILVNDCSPDHSWTTIHRLARDRPWLKGLNLRKNSGQHNAILAGIKRSSGDYIITMDDDLQHDPGDIPALIEALGDDYDVCYATFRSKRHAAWKRLGSAFNDRIANILLGKPKGLYLSPFKAFSRPIAREIADFTGPHVYIDGLILSSTSRITTVQTEHHKRLEGQSGYNLRKSISLWLKMATNFSVTPLRAASILGLTFALIGFLLAIGLVIQKFTLNVMPIGWSSLIVTLLFIGGIQLAALGIIGEYVGRILLHVNGRPQTVVAHTLNFDADDRRKDT